MARLAASILWMAARVLSHPHIELRSFAASWRHPELRPFAANGRQSYHLPYRTPSGLRQLLLPQLHNNFFHHHLCAQYCHYNVFNSCYDGNFFRRYSCHRNDHIAIVVDSYNRSSPLRN